MLEKHLKSPYTTYTTSVTAPDRPFRFIALRGEGVHIEDILERGWLLGYCTYDVVIGVVYQLPEENGVARYVAGIEMQRLDDSADIRGWVLHEETYATAELARTAADKLSEHVADEFLRAMPITTKVKQLCEDFVIWNIRGIAHDAVRVWRLLRKIYKASFHRLYLYLSGF